MSGNHRTLAITLVALGFIAELAAIVYLAVQQHPAVPLGIAILVAGLALVFAGIALLRRPPAASSG